MSLDTARRGLGGATHIAAKRLPVPPAFARRQSPQAMPMFLSRKALAETWALSRVAGVVATQGEPRLSRVGFTANFGVEGRQRPSSDARVCARW